MRKGFPLAWGCLGTGMVSGYVGVVWIEGFSMDRSDLVTKLLCPGQCRI